MNMAPDETDTATVEAGKKSSGSGSNWILHCLAVLSLLALNYILYARTIPIGFLSVDDPDYVQNNGLIENFSRANLKHICTKPYQANYAPATLLSYSVDVALARGKSASAIHLSNVLWHGWVVLCVYLFAFVLRGEIVTATGAALLFLLHPAHVEVVAWISSRKDLVATGFAVLSMTCYLLWRRQARHNPAWFVASLSCFLFACAAKQSVLLLPVVMLIWDIFVEKRIGWAILFEKLPFALIVWFFGWMTWRAQPSTNQAWHPFILAATELTNLRLLAGLGDFVMYRPAPDLSLASSSVQIGLMVLAGLVWLLPVAAFARQQPVRLFLSWWVLIQMIPPTLLNFVVPVTDRYLFLPSVGVCILLADLASALATRIGKAWVVAFAALAALAAFWAIQTCAYVDEWADPRSVWHRAHLKTSSPQVSQFLGEVYQNAGDRISSFAKTGAVLEVAKESRLAQAILQNNDQVERLRIEWTGAAPSRTNSLAYRDRLWSLARELYNDAVAHRGTLSTPNLFMNRGRLLVSEGEYERAILEFQTALAFAKSSSYSVIRQETTTHALRAIAVAYWNMKKFKEAQEWMLKAKDVQRKSHTVWVPTLDKELEQLQALAATQP